MSRAEPGRILASALSLKGGDVVGLLTVTTFLMVVGYALTAPVIPLYAASLGFAAVQIGAVVAAFGFARLTFDLASGVLGDRFGFRPMAVGGCVLASVGALVSASSRGGGSLFVGQAVSGVGSALYNAAALTAVIVHSDPRQKARTLGRYYTAMSVGFSAGPVFGGFIAEVSGFRTPFFAFALFALVVALLLGRNLPSAGTSGRVRVARPPLIASLRHLLSSTPFRIALVVVATGHMIRSGVRDTAVPIFATEEFALGASIIGLLSGVAVVSNAALLPHAGKVLDRIGRRPVTIWSCAGTGVVLLLLAGVGELWQMFGAMLLLGVVSAYAGLAPVASLADLIDDESPGTSVGLQRMGVDLGMVIGPLIAGVSIQYFDARATFVVFAAFMLVVSALSSLAPETVRRDMRRV